MIDNKETPVLLILFNRVSISNELLKSLREAKPKIIYIFFDGPRDQQKNSDQSSINLIEQDINEIIDWECDFFIKRNKNNVGSHIGPKQAIDWLFSKEERGIILEDDCIPDKYFFEYCNELLSVYESNKKIFMISGDNAGPIVNEDLFNSNSYLFTKIPLTWGWATWKDRWDKLDQNFDTWSKKTSANKRYLNDFSLYENLIIKKMLRRVSSREEKNWDYVLYSTMIKNNCYSIMPKYNLIRNIGWGEVATHTKVKNFRSFGNTKKINILNFNGEIKNSIDLDTRISYIVHFGISQNLAISSNLNLIRIIHLLKRLRYFIFLIYKKLTK